MIYDLVVWVKVGVIKWGPSSWLEQKGENHCMKCVKKYQ